MNYKNYVLLAFVTFLILGIYGIYLDILSIKIVCHILPTIFLSIWFFLEIRHNFNFINKYLLVGILMGSVSYLSWIVFYDYFYGLFSVFTGTLMLLLLTYVIRIEGVTLASNLNSNIFKLILPFFVIFSFYGILLLPILPEIPLVFTSIYALALIIFASHSFNRKANSKDYYLTCIGAIILIIKDLLYAIHFYVLEKQFPFLYISIYLLSPIAIYFIIAGLINVRKTAVF